MLGRDLTHDDEMFLAGKDQGVSRYFRFTTDHKVVGVQYLVLAMGTFGVGGLLAMMIRTDPAVARRSEEMVLARYRRSSTTGCSFAGSSCPARPWML